MCGLLLFLSKFCCIKMRHNVKVAPEANEE
jgi:hypothetical protein